MYIQMFPRQTKRTETGCGEVDSPIVSVCVCVWVGGGGGLCV